MYICTCIYTYIQSILHTQYLVDMYLSSVPMEKQTLTQHTSYNTTNALIVNNCHEKIKIEFLQD